MRSCTAFLLGIFCLLQTISFTRGPCNANTKIKTVRPYLRHHICSLGALAQCSRTLSPTGKRSVPLASLALHKRRVAVQREILADCLLCPSKSMCPRRLRQRQHAKRSKKAAWRGISVCRSREEKPSSGMYLRHSCFCAVCAAATPT